MLSPAPAAAPSAALLDGNDELSCADPRPVQFGVGTGSVFQCDARNHAKLPVGDVCYPGGTAWGPAVLPSQRAETKLWQVVGLAGNGQIDVAVKLIAEVASLFDVPTLELVMGRGGRHICRPGWHCGLATITAARSWLSRRCHRCPRSGQGAACQHHHRRQQQGGRSGGQKATSERANGLLRAAVQQAKAGNSPHLLKVLYNLAVVQLQRGRHDEAKSTLAKVDPVQLPEALVAQGALAEAVGDPRGALEQYRRYLSAGGAANPPGEQLASVRDWVDAMARFYEGAAPHAEPASDASPNQSKACCGTAEAAMKRWFRGLLAFAILFWSLTIQAAAPSEKVLAIHLPGSTSRSWSASSIWAVSWWPICSSDLATSTT